MARNFHNRAHYSRRRGPHAGSLGRGVYGRPPTGRRSEPPALPSLERPGEPKRYSGRDDEANAFDEFMDSLGRPGKILRWIAEAIQREKGGRGEKRRGRRSESAAKDLLETFGSTVVPPTGRQTESEAAEALDAARQFLREQGFGVQRPDPTEPPIVDPQPSTSTSGNVVEVDFGNGGKRQFNVNHPIVTKDWVHTPSSSNVYRFLFDLDKSALFVQYDARKTEMNSSKRRGPVYRYSNVSPAVFLAMIKASSKGSFVWDKLRVRGTTSGHKYDYELTHVTEGFVPRKATAVPDGEMFVERTVRGRTRDGRTKVLKSKPTGPAGAPNRAAPNRGRPNRGR